MKIGILTSGGDSPGMNTAVWAAARAAYSKGIEIVAIRHGYQGLMTNDIIPLTQDAAESMLNMGGTRIRTSRCKEMRTLQGRKHAVKTLKENKIDGLIVCGGDGSFRGAEKLSNLGIATIGIPGTIDNDLAYTDYTIGFDTACNNIVENVMKIRDTMRSHNRIGIVEVMGRNCGDLALLAGMASGADYVLVPEKQGEFKSKYNIDEVFRHVKETWYSGKHYAIIIIAEGVGKDNNDRAYNLRKLLEAKIDEHNKMLMDTEESPELIVTEVRETVLGYLQRGGSPTVQDRRLATESAIKAVELLEAGETNRVVGIRENKIIHMDTDEALSIVKEFDDILLSHVNSLLTSR
ncbi:MAG: ATP-dependent 6-phosphofructokinase [Eubacteriales bacterium]